MTMAWVRRARESKKGKQELLQETHDLPGCTIATDGVRVHLLYQDKEGKYRI